VFSVEASEVAFLQGNQACQYHQHDDHGQGISRQCQAKIQAAFAISIAGEQPAIPGLPELPG
jgi:hypothetical protein